MDPEISVIIPTYNRATTLRRAINSVVLQTFQSKEIIIIDDGSKDQANVVASNYPEVKYFFQENKGVCVARNEGAKIANGKWLIFLDSDDELTQECLLRLRDSLSESYDVIKWGVDWVLSDGVKKRLIRDGKRYVPNLSGTFAIKRNEFYEIGGYDEHLKFGENTELFHRIRIHKLREIELPFVGLTYFDSVEGGSKNLQNAIESNLYILKKHDQTLSTHTKHLFHQIIGVNQMRFRRFPEARKHLWKAYAFKPFKLKTLGRLLISIFPLLAISLYSEKVK